MTKQGLRGGRGMRGEGVTKRGLRGSEGGGE